MISQKMPAEFSLENELLCSIAPAAADVDAAGDAVAAAVGGDDQRLVAPRRVVRGCRVRQVVVEEVDRRGDARVGEVLLQPRLVAAEELQHLQRAVDRRPACSSRRRTSASAPSRPGGAAAAWPRSRSPAPDGRPSPRSRRRRGRCRSGRLPCTRRASAATGTGTRSASSGASSAPRWRRRRRGRRRRGPRRLPRRHECRGRSSRPVQPRSSGISAVPSAHSTATTASTRK